jgi:hypothetical protein
MLCCGDRDRKREMSGPKVVPLQTKDEMKAGIDAMKRNMPIILEHMALVASMKRTYYLALVEQGFTEAQALELCKAPASA